MLGVYNGVDAMETAKRLGRGHGLVLFPLIRALSICAAVERRHCHRSSTEARQPNVSTSTRSEDALHLTPLNAGVQEDTYLARRQTESAVA